jgi:hypothetical protein
MYLYYVTFMFVPRFDVNEIKAIAIAFSWFWLMNWRLARSGNYEHHLYHRNHSRQSLNN